MTTDTSNSTTTTETQQDDSLFVVDISMGNDDDEGNKQDKQPKQQQQQPAAAETTLHLRWTNLFKSVEIKDNAGAKKGRWSYAGISSKGGSIHPNNANNNKSTKVILDRVSGEAYPGEILATMGPSGSGKTSLMNVLSGRAAYQEGTISMNGMILDKAGMKKLMSRVAYVKQQDIFFESLTVRDQLTYTAKLRFPDTGTTTEERGLKFRTEVDKILDLLRLTRVADSPIMMCSGGEKKRVNIGTELLTNPSIILLDEPTSGLDSASAVSLLGVLRDLAKNQGKTIITSIHQPNSATFLNTFDKLLMLSDGNTVYFGTPVDSLRYLKSRGFPCPEGYNAADHWMDLLVITDYNNNNLTNSNSVVETQYEEYIGGGRDWSQKSKIRSVGGRDWSQKSQTRTSSRKTSTTRVAAPKFYLQSIWDNDTLASNLREAAQVQLGITSIDDGGINASERNSFGTQNDQRGSSSGSSSSKYTTSWMTQYKTLTHRALKKSKLTVFSPVNVVKTIATGFAVGIVYLNKTYTEVDVFNIYAYFFFVMLYWVMDGMFAALFDFPQERIVILKERATASYRLSAYYCAMTTADLPVRLAMPFVFLIISYWMVVPILGLNTFLLILPICLLSVVTGQGMGQLVGSAFDDIQVAQAVATVVVLFLMLLGGFFANNLPIWLSWVRFVSPFAYASNAALGIIFSKPVPCDGSGALGSLCSNSDDGYADPEAVKASFSVYGTVLSNSFCLIAACILPRLLAYWFLRRKKAGERE